MDYKIGGKAYLCNASSSLKNLETGEEFHLPPSAIFILTMLIKNHGQPVSRENFFDSAWNDYGFQLSGNTLSQHISLLRKTIRNFGITDEVILTIPRLGFCLDESVEVISVPLKFHKPTVDFKVKPWKCFCIFLAIILVLVQVIWISNNKKLKIIFNPASLGKIGNCEIYSTHRLSQNYSVETLKIASLLAKKYLPCGQDEVYIVDTGSGLIFHHDGRAFLSRCDLVPHGKDLSGCQEVLIYEGEKEHE